MKSKIIELALSQYGIKEDPTSASNKTVLDYFAESGHSWVKDDTNYAWCSAFMNWVAKKAGLPYTKNLMARSWLTVGKEVKKPEIGDICVFCRGSINASTGHVSIFIREDGDKIFCLGGNQSDQVNISIYSKSQLLCYRDITQKSPSIEFTKELKRGDKGSEVKQLQKMIGVDQDGDFGPITERVLKQFQTSHGLPATGILDKNTQKSLINN